MAAYPHIKKQDGTYEPFDSRKLRASLRRSGASSGVIDRAVSRVEQKIREGDTTSEIYRYAFSLLKREKENISAARYSMKRAIQALGPSGFPFEDFIAEIFKAQGYQTETGKVLEGACATHEVDLVAKRGDECIGAEIKFHNNLGLRSDLKVALYVDARFVDLKPKKVQSGWLITNTRFTKEALRYGACRGLTMISWAGPEGNSLQDMIERAGVEPITALPSLSRREKALLFERGAILCRSIGENPDVLDGVVSPQKKSAIIEESRLLCESGVGV
jgi:hypothetical protein